MLLSLYLPSCSAYTLAPLSVLFCPVVSQSGISAALLCRVLLALAFYENEPNRTAEIEGFENADVNSTKIFSQRHLRRGRHVICALCFIGCVHENSLNISSTTVYYILPAYLPPPPQTTTPSKSKVWEWKSRRHSRFEQIPQWHFVYYSRASWLFAGSSEEHE